MGSGSYGTWLDFGSKFSESFLVHDKYQENVLEYKGQNEAYYKKIQALCKGML